MQSKGALHPDQLGPSLMTPQSLWTSVWSEGLVQTIAAIMLAGTTGGSAFLFVRGGFFRSRGKVVASRSTGRVVRWSWPLSVTTVHLWSLGVLIEPSVFYLFPLSPSRLPDIVQWLGVALWGVSGILILWSTWTMGRAMRPQVQVAQGQELVTWGPFRWVRHPVYVGNILTGLGMSLAFLSLPCLLLTIAVLIAALRRTAIEEEMLASPQGYGPEYEGYVSRTGRFLPRRSR